MAIVIPPTGTRIWLISGISNARGMGAVAELPATYNPHYKSIYSLDQLNRWVAARDPLIRKGGAYPALAHPTMGGVGCGIAFANKMIDMRPGLRVGLVVSARGGQIMPYFMPSDDAGSAYRAIVARALTAKSIGSIQGMIWYSGEADTSESVLVDQWEANFKTTIDQLRVDLGMFPVLLCAIGDHTGKFALEPRHSQWLRLRAIQMAIKHPMVHPVGTRGMPLKDTAHLSTAGQIQLGRNLARVYAQYYS